MDWWLQIFVVVRFLKHLVHHLYQESDKLKKMMYKCVSLEVKQYTLPVQHLIHYLIICIYIEFKNELFQFILIISLQVEHYLFYLYNSTTRLSILIDFHSPRLTVLSFNFLVTPFLTNLTINYIFFKLIAIPYVCLPSQMH